MKTPSEILSITDKLFDFICDYQNQKGYSPTLREMASFMNINSTASISHYLEYLQGFGKIKKPDFKKRSIEIISKPHSFEMSEKENLIKISSLDEKMLIYSNIFPQENMILCKIDSDVYENINLKNGDYVLISCDILPKNGDLVANLDEGKIFFEEYNKKKAVFGTIVYTIKRLI